MSLENSSNQSSLDHEPIFYLFNVTWVLLFLLAIITGLIGNLFIVFNILRDVQMRNTNYFFVLSLVVVDLLVILTYITVRELALKTESENVFLHCFSTVWNFVVNYTASNYILLFLCYEKFILIILPFQKMKYLSMRVKVIFTTSVCILTLAILALKYQNMGAARDEEWCSVSYPRIDEWQSDLIDITLFIIPILIQISLYSYIFCKAQQVAHRFDQSQAVGKTKTPAAGTSNNVSNQNHSIAPPHRQNPQLRVAKTCLVATFVRFVLWFPYIVHLVRSALLHAFSDVDVSDTEQRPALERIANAFFPDLTIIASCTNPIVFIVMSPPLQRSLKSVCQCCFNKCRRNSKPNGGDDNVLEERMCAAVSQCKDKQPAALCVPNGGDIDNKQPMHSEFVTSCA